MSQTPTGNIPAPETGQNPAESKPDKASPAAGQKPPSPKSPSKSPKSAAHKRRSHARRLAEAPAPEGEPRKVVIHRGGVSEPVAQIIPGMTMEEARRQRQETQDLLTAADSDLKKLAARALNSSQQETVSQIRHYMDVARTALTDGDIQRAHTLAQKAQLLSDDLVQR